MPRIFSGRPARGTRGRRADDHDGAEDADDGPKSPAPRFTLGMPTMPSPRFRMPSLARTRTRGSSDTSSRADSPAARSNEGTPRQSPNRTRTERFPVVAEPEAAHADDDDDVEGHMGRTRFRGTGPADLHLANLASRGRRRRHQHRRGGSDASRRERRRNREPPTKFLFCFPWVESRRMRSQILRCFVSGIFLTLMLTVYLSLSISKNINSSEFTILLILIILFTTIFFCHGLVRICLLVVRPKGDGDNAEEAEAEAVRAAQLCAPGGYAIPRRPIRVVLARDEEAAGIESEATKLQPPAYGLWRESVRVDPDRIYWQRNEEQEHQQRQRQRQRSSSGESGRGEPDGVVDEDEDRPHTGQPRPPSYASDDGVDYVVEARPRSMAPLTDVPLPPHPSEVVPGRPGAF
ncbi:Uu.00g103870.m01.CDS01 [Anthostomella pinea]|uniref:Uu.00g103870.m01.CDS01 n=1 Tax=Anthostomella pinea TaxID=933095 RepID=A0AAI8VEL4_9PEZI|nr:Uu.00g103870.m01.CDS01 [Anthostomella pinea]